ncbi:protein-glutamate O-methyltransferase CheR [Deinococcus taeanensis]|uniref:CheR family methyltransferase n=1 Tax=Deinococcus taeanensis TaxID=2737050 RepID=UPI001CDCE79A|nr:protein-glutamate O-methyltransferase CheR [Deinococcus taeanensis]UBV42001.1 protein-glutamate O-methyltransferase CheR [Deinococcus taeanensis]
MKPTFHAEPLEEIELSLLLEGVFRATGHDFRAYTRATIRRRVLHAVAAEGLRTISALQGQVLRDPAAMQRLRETLAINVTGMFRDPTFFQALREQVIPTLRTHPFIRVWHAGCSTGEEVYSLAILLSEAGLLERTRLYATDMHAPALGVARQGIYPAAKMNAYEAAYQDAGGQADFRRYFTWQYDHALVRADLRQPIIWGQHNLATDSSFNEFHLILCRNVLIYFTRPLQDHVKALLHDSLTPFGILALGRHETMDFSVHAPRFECLNLTEKLYRRVG